jgi:cytoskeletal protein CcmA (bactofilin family)
VKGNIKFEGLIRIEGSVEGQLVSSHDVSQLSTKQQLTAVMTVTFFLQ